MTVEDLPDLNPPDFGDVSDPARPILAYSWSAEGAHRVAAHRHLRAHVIHTGIGAYWVATPEGTWLVPRGQAIWIPPNVHHEVYAHGSAAARIIFVDPVYANRLPPRCGTVEISPLLEALLDRTVEYGNDYPPDGPAARLALVMLDELGAMNVAPLLLPLGRDSRLVGAMDRLIANPSADVGLEEVSHEAGASARTLARLFVNETGMTFTQWKTRLLLVESIERLSRGASVTEVAIDLGYGSSSSFAYMFRNKMGVPPGQYVPGTTPAQRVEP